MTTKRVRMLDSLSNVLLTPDQPRIHLRNGHEYDVPTDLANAWIEQRYAVAVKRKTRQQVTPDKGASS